jgi:hypothetical protein
MAHDERQHRAVIATDLPQLLDGQIRAGFTPLRILSTKWAARRSISRKLSPLPRMPGLRRREPILLKRQLQPKRSEARLPEPHDQ